MAAPNALPFGASSVPCVLRVPFNLHRRTEPSLAGDWAGKLKPTAAPERDSRRP